MSALDCVSQLSLAWQAAVEYRRCTAETFNGTPRPHLEDMDLWGALQELHEDGHLIGTPAEVMTRVITERRTLPLPPVIHDPPQEIYDACIELCTALGVLNEGFFDQ